MDQTERQQRTSCKMNYWRYFWCLFSCSSLDTHFGDLFSLERYRSPSVKCCFSKLGRTLILQHLLFDACFTELSLVYLKDQALTASPSTASENKWCNGLSCENSYSNADLIWEISHNLFFRPFELADFGEERGRMPEETFQKGKRRNHWSHPREQQVSRRHTVCVERGPLRCLTFSYIRRLWPQSSDIEEQDFTRLLLKLCKKK